MYAPRLPPDGQQQNWKARGDPLKSSNLLSSASEPGGLHGARHGRLIAEHATLVAAPARYPGYLARWSSGYDWGVGNHFSKVKRSLTPLGAPNRALKGLHISPESVGVDPTFRCGRR